MNINPLNKIFVKTDLLIILLMVLIPTTLMAGGTGPTSVTTGQSATYTWDGGVLYFFPSWTVSGNGTFQMSQSGTKYICTVTWPSATSATVTFKNGGTTLWNRSVTISNPPLVAGGISGAQTLCYNGNPGTITSSSSASGGTGSYSYQWQWKYIITGSSWANISGATGTTYNPLAQTATKDFRRRVISGSSTKYTSSVRITIYGDLNPGSISGSTTLCYNGNPSNFSNTASASGGNSSKSYQWQIRSPGGSWANISGATSSTYNKGTMTSTKEFRRRVISCSQTKYSNTITVTIRPALSPGSIGNAQSICPSADPAALTNNGSAGGGNSSYSYQWQKRSPGGSWSNISGATATTYDEGAMTSTKEFRRQVVSCSQTKYSNTITITVNQNPASPITPSVSSNTCGNKTLTHGTPPGGETWYWQGTNSSGTSTSNSSSTYNVSTSGTYYIRARSSAGCWSQALNSVGVTVNPIPIQYTLTYSGDVCDLVDQSGTGGTTFTLSDTEAGVNYQLRKDGANYGSIISGTGNALNWSNIWDPGTFTVEATHVTGGCNISMTGSQVFSLNPLPSVTANDIDVFIQGTVSLADGSPSAGTWSGSYISNGIFDAPTAGIGTYGATYTYTNSGTGCVNSASINIKVLANPLVNIENVNGMPIIGHVALITIQDDGYTYQWRKNGQNISGATNFQYATNIDGSYSVIVNTGSDTYTSTDFSITVNTATYISGPDFLTGAINSGTLTLKNYSGTVQKWEIADADTLVNLTATSSTYAISNLSQETYYRVLLLNNTITEYSPWKRVSWQDNPDSTFVENNYVKIESLTSAVTDTANIASANGLTTSYSYYDGLGRQKQSVLKAVTPSQSDVIAFSEYDSLGRSKKRYLPFAGSGTDYYTNLVGRQTSFYDTTSNVATSSYPYAEIKVDNSPYQRVLESGAQGEDWQLGNGNTVQFSQGFNTANQVRKWKPDGTNDGYHTANRLSVRTITDENGNRVKIYTNARAQQVLKEVEESTNTYLQTYSVYSELGQLVYTLPPLATDTLAGGNIESTSAVDELKFKYTYDSRGRLVEKKVPGAEAQFIVYDQLDRVVLTQDGNMRADDQWSFIKYDRKGRITYSGLYTNTTNTTRASVQALLDALDYNASDYWYEVAESNTTFHGYSNQAFPTTNSQQELLSVNYYDNYDFDRTGTTNDYTYTSNHLTGQEASNFTRIRGFATGSKTKILGTTTWLTTVIFYDDEGRVIQSKANNHMNTAVSDISTIVYNDDLGVVDKVKVTQYSTTTEKVDLVSSNSYDAKGRLLSNSITVDSDGPVELAAYSYNELGQVIEKKLHKVNSSQYAQAIDYSYTIRGWLESINDADNITNNKMFGMELIYNDSLGGLNHTKAYNGNISAMRWNSTNNIDTLDVRAYAYTYDKMDRLTNANYGEGTGFSTNADRFGISNLTYDANGNILSLKREGLDANDSLKVTIDDLTYTYATGNQMSKVADTAIDSIGFNDGATMTTEYTYDANGNMTLDENKDISSIHYNIFNKPDTITYSDGREIVYTYSGSGSKLRQETFQGTTLTQKLDYIGAMLYEDDTLQMIQHGDGRIIPTGNAGYPYEYQYTLPDHLGNTRATFTARNSLDTLTATMEDVFGFDDMEEKYFMRLDSSRVTSSTYNHTVGPSYNDAARLLGEIGPGTMLTISASDTVNMEVYAKYPGSGGKGADQVISSFITSLISGYSVIGAGESGLLTTMFNSSGLTGVLLAPESGDNTVPNASLEYVFFDKNFAYKSSGFIAVSSSAADAFEKLSITVPFNEKGYLYIYVNNTSKGKYVYFDDMQIVHSKNNLAEPIQLDDYYPFGMQTQDSWVATNTDPNNYLFNASSELNETTQNYQTFFRDYDPALGRMTGIDIMASKYSSVSPYNFALNDPIGLNDPNGDDVLPERNTGGEVWADGRGWANDNLYGWSYGGGGTRSAPASGGTGASLFGSGGSGSGESSATGIVNGIAEGLASRFGGNVNVGDGSFTPFGSGGEAMAAGNDYNNYNNSWGNTFYGSLEYTMLAYKTAVKHGFFPSKSSIRRTIAAVRYYNNKNAHLIASDSGYPPGGDDPKWLTYVKSFFNQKFFSFPDLGGGSDEISSSTPDALKITAGVTTAFGGATAIAIYGSRPIYTGPMDWSRQKALGLKFGKRVGTFGLFFSAYNILFIDGRPTTSNALDLGFGLAGIYGGPIGATASGIYFTSNLLIYGFTGKDIGEQIDSQYYIPNVGGMGFIPIGRK